MSDSRSACSTASRYQGMGTAWGIERDGDLRFWADVRPPDGTGGELVRRGWGSPVWPESHLTYTIDIALTTEFALAAGGAR